MYVAPPCPAFRRLRRALFCGAIFALWPTSLLAAEPVATGLPLASAAPPAIRPLVWFDWQGEIRLRGEAMHGLRLATDPDHPARLDLRHGSFDPPEVPQLPAGETIPFWSMNTADVRLRFNPVMHVGEWSDVHSQIDLGRGVVMGSDPRSATLPWTAADASQPFSGIAGQGPLRDGVAVRRLWLTGRVFGFGEVDIGRMGDHFGMGMFRNSGGDLIGDFQDDVDRLAVRADLFGLRMMVARDNLASLPAAGWNPNLDIRVGKDAAGNDVTVPLTTNQAVQRSQQDSNDVVRWTAEVHGGKRKAELGLRWSAALQYTTQETGLRAEHEVETATSGCKLASCQMLINRTARFLNPELALDWQGTLGGQPLRLQAEGVLQYGTFGNIGARATPGTDTTQSRSIDSPLTIVAGGIAARGSLRIDRSELKLDTGYASGASDGGFGVNDTDNLHWNGSTRPDAPLRTFLSGFHFHRNYRIDGLLFRDVIGAVANTVYFKPAWRFVISEGADTLGVEGSVLAALAASKNATPGHGTVLGIEPEVTLDYTTASGMAGILRSSLLLPGSAFSSDGHSADPAVRVEAIWRLSF